MSAHPIFGEVISSYSRKEAIEDGVLIDLMQPETAAMVRSLGFTFPIAMTANAYDRAVCPLDGELPNGQDRNGRLWDVLWMLRIAIKGARGGTTAIPFQVWVSQGEGAHAKTELVTLNAVCGPGDESEPVITILLPGED